jgi:hypothetical protein
MGILLCYSTKNNFSFPLDRTQINYKGTGMLCPHHMVYNRPLAKVRLYEVLLRVKCSEFPVKRSLLLQKV